MFTHKPVLFFVWSFVALPVICEIASAQDIMSFEEYQKLDHEEPYIVRLDLEPGAFLYFGSRHSFDPADRQMLRIEEEWNEFKPEIAYTEGGNLSVESLSKEQAIRRYGEFGLVRFLAARDGVPAQSLDPDRGDEVVFLKEQGWSDEQLMLFYTLRQISQSRKQQALIDFSVVLPRYLGSLEERFELDGPSTIEEFDEAVARLLPGRDDWKEIPESFFYPGPQQPSSFTNAISTDSNRFRDQFHVRLLTKQVLAGKRVFAIVGSAHVVMQEPAIRKSLISGQ